jgi:pimeloyl-ACP methyl ester carboxylesterase
VHLAHANGFPPRTYAALARRLAARCRVFAAPLRPLHPAASPAGFDDWQAFADDLLAVLAARPDATPVIGVGHSMGGVATAFAAARRPDLFRAVVLIDPILFAGLRAFFWSWLRRLRLAHTFPLSRAARRRREVWSSPAAARAAWRPRPLFAGVPDEVLDDYVAAALVADPAGGWRLRYPRDWEARVFETAPSEPWRCVARLRQPVLVLRGAQSDAFTPEAARRLRRALPHAAVADVPGTGHMLPFQRPDEVAERILRFVERLG